MPPARASLILEGLKTLVNARRPLPPGPVRILCHRRSGIVVSLARGLGADERPDARVQWAGISLDARQNGRLGVLDGDYDPERHQLAHPAYRTVSVPEAGRLAREVADLIAEEDARWARIRVFDRLHDLARPAVLPGPGTLTAVLAQLRDRPGLLVSLMAIHRRHPELVLAQRERVGAAVIEAVRRVDSRDAAAAAHAADLLLQDRAAALELLARWTPPAERVQANQAGAEVLAVPDELALAHLSRCDPDDEVARAFAKHHLLDPLAVDLDLETAMPLPSACTTGLPRLADVSDAMSLLVAQLDGFERVGDLLVALHAGAGVDRMPTIGPRPPDSTGLRATLHVVCDGDDAVRLDIGPAQVAWRGRSPVGKPVDSVVVPARTAMRIHLGALDDTALEPGAEWELGLPLAAGAAATTVIARGRVTVVW